MSNEKKTRSVAEIQAEYQGLCTRAGHFQYQIFNFTKDLELVNQKLRDLNFEAAAAHQAEQEAAKASETPAEAPKLAAVPQS